MAELWCQFALGSAGSVNAISGRLNPNNTERLRDRIFNMQYYELTNGFTLVFKKGEPFIATLTDFCQAQGINAGFFHGLGGVLSVELGYYYLDSKEYEFKRLDEVLEIASLHGNVAIKDGQPFIHAHGVFSDAGLNTYGGHIKEMKVGGTCELQLQVFDTKWHRKKDEDTGLSLIDFDAEPA